MRLAALFFTYSYVNSVGDKLTKRHCPLFKGDERNEVLT